MFNIPTYLIEQTVLTSDLSTVTLTVDTSGLPFTPRHLLIRINGRTTRATANAAIEVSLNGDSGSNYNAQQVYAESSSAVATRTNARDYLWKCFVPGASRAAEIFGGGEALIPDAFSTRTHKSLISLFATDDQLVAFEAARWASTAAITSVVFKTDGNNIEAGTILELAVVDESFNHSEQII
jgi:hypothetical protein